MAADPPEDDIEAFRSITQLDRGTSVRWLQAYNNDLNMAINHCLESDGEPPEVPAYDESAFSQDRQGGYAHDLGAPAFQIDYGLGAPTRPQSKASNRGSEDSGVEMMPAGMPGTPSGQEIGLVSASGNFRPATRPYYDASQWALTLPGTSVAEIVPDADVSNQKRAEGMPCFLKPSPGDCDFLPPLLTILSAIPLARNSLLLGEAIRDDYGSSPEWWKGSPIRLSGPREVDTSGDNSKHVDLIHETQRLVAFLENSARSYGTVDNIKLLLDAVDLSRRELDSIALSTNKSVAEAFLIKWTTSCLRLYPEHEAQNCLFYSSIGQNENSLCTFTVEPIVHGVDHGAPVSLYDILDKHMFSLGSESASPLGILENAKVLTLRLTQPIEAPLVFYADRYMTENHTKVMDMRKGMDEYQQIINSIEKERKRSLTIEAPSLGGEVAMAALLNAAKSAFAAPELPEELDPDLLEIEDLLRPDPEVQDRRNQLIAELEEISRAVELKAKVLEVQLEESRSELRNISKLFTGQDTAGESPRVRYTLRGVSIDSNETFVLQPTKGLYKSMDSTEKTFQWWKIKYAYADRLTPQITTEEVTEEDVVKAVNTTRAYGLPGTLMVYATDDAVNCPLEPLPAPLQTFVEHDNLQFLTDFDGFQEGVWVDDSWSQQMPVAGPVYTVDEEADPPPYDPSLYHDRMARDSWGLDAYQEEKKEVDLRDETMGNELSTPDIEMTEKSGSSLLSSLQAGAVSHSQSDVAMIDPEDLSGVQTGDKAVHIENVGKWQPGG